MSETIVVNTQPLNLVLQEQNLALTLGSGGGGGGGSNCCPTGILSPLNSSNVPLPGTSTFIGTGIDTINYAAVEVEVYTDHNGTLQLEFSSDDTNWDITTSYSITGLAIPFVMQLVPLARWFRVVYTNGGTAQTVFRLQTVLKQSAGVPVGQPGIPGFDAVYVQGVLNGVPVPISGTVTATFSPSGTQTVAGTVTTVPTGTQTVAGTVTASFSPSGTQTVIQAANSSVTVANFPATQTVTGSTTVTNFPATQTVTGTVVTSGTTTVTVPGTVTASVVNFPATQTVTGTTTISNFPATQTVIQAANSSVTVANFPATQTVAGQLTTGVLSAGNSSSATLVGGGVFTGTAVDVTNYAAVEVIVNTDQNGTFLVEFSTDAVNYDVGGAYSVVANTPFAIQLVPIEKYFRVVYTNGATTQTFFRLQTMLKVAAGVPVGLPGTPGIDAVYIQGIASGIPIPISGSTTVVPSGTQTVTGSVTVTNFPATQTVTGTTTVSNFPATQTVIQAVNSSVTVVPSGTQTITGTVVSSGTTTVTIPGTITTSVSNFPATQTVAGQLTTGVVSTNNSSTATLAGNGVFTGTSDDITNYEAVEVTVYTDQASAASGLQLEFSEDNSHWDIANNYSVVANTPFSIQLVPQSRYFRIVYTNGSSGQTVFRLQTIYKVAAGIPVGGAGIAGIDAVYVQGITNGVPQPISGSVSVTNFPATQTITGTTTISNFPATQTVAGTVAISGTTTVTGTVVNNGGSVTVIPSGTQTVQTVYNSTNNTTTLAGNASVTVGPFNLNAYQAVEIFVDTDQASAAGGLSIQFSIDNTVYTDLTYTFSVAANTPFHTQFVPPAQFFQIVYTNGSVAQTKFRLQTFFKGVTGVPIGSAGINGPQAAYVQGVTGGVAIPISPSGTQTVIPAANSSVTVVPSGTQTVTGFPATQTVITAANSSVTVVPSGTQTVAGFPATQTVAGAVFPSSWISTPGANLTPWNTAYTGTAASNTAVTLTVAAVAAKYGVLTGVAWSYTGGTPTGSVLIQEGGTTMIQFDITNNGPGFIPFVPPLRTTATNVAITATLAAGGTGVTGRLNFLGAWTTT